MKKNRFPVMSGVLICLALSILAGCPLFDDPLYETPKNFTVQAYSYMAYLSWDTVPGVSAYRVRLNGERVADLTAASWYNATAVVLGDRYTVSAVYSGDREGQPAGPVLIRSLDYFPPYSLPVPATELDNSRSMVSAPGTARPLAWFDTAMVTGQTAHYYIIPIEKNYGQYRFWWNDSYQGAGKTLDVRVYAWWYGTNVTISPPSGTDSGYNNAGISVDSASPDNTGYLVLRVQPYFGPGNTGTYGIAYNWSLSIM
jgi:chitodextrinase